MEYPNVINVFFVLVPDRVEVKRSRIRHVASGLVRYNCDVVAYLVLIRIALERIKWITYRNIRCPGNASVGAKRIEQLRVCVVYRVSRVIPDRIEPSIGRDRKCPEPVPLARVNRVVINLMRCTEG